MIKTAWIWGVFAIVLVVAGPAAARDDKIMFPIKEALAAPEAKARLDKGVRLHFGGGFRGGVAKDYGVWDTNKKTNAFMKSDQTACEWAFLSAVLELQERARKMGGNAVVEITSNYKNIPTNSASEYMCGAGNIMAGVALKGRVIKTGGN